MSNYSFRKDLRRENETIDDLIKQLLLLKWMDAAEVTKNDNSDYDLKILTAAKETILIEVKEDFYHKKSGNIAIEFESRGKKSGISVSKADYYFIKAHYNTGWVLYSILTSELKDLIKSQKYCNIILNGGDRGSKTCFYLFKLNDVLDSFEVVIDGRNSKIKK